MRSVGCVFAVIVACLAMLSLICQATGLPQPNSDTSNSGSESSLKFDVVPNVKLAQHYRGPGASNAVEKAFIPLDIHIYGSSRGASEFCGTGIEIGANDFSGRKISRPLESSENDMKQQFMMIQLMLRKIIPNQSSQILFCIFTAFQFSFVINGRETSLMNASCKCLSIAPITTEHGTAEIWRAIAKISVPGRHVIMQYLRGPLISELKWTISVSQNGKQATAIAASSSNLKLHSPAIHFQDLYKQN